MGSKSVFALLAGLAISLGALAQQPAGGTHSRRSTVNFTELARQQAQQPAQAVARKTQHAPMPTPRFRAPEGVRGIEKPQAKVSAQQVPIPLVASPSPAASFAALGDANTSIPPDTHGAVGPNHLMVVLNTQVVMQNRSGTVVQGPVSLDSFWAALGNPDVFDPKVLYDHLSGRWIFTAMANSRSANSAILMGASQTNDPSGTWNLFSIDADAAGTNWADYPSMGYNKDWVVVNLNMFAVSNNAFHSTRLYIFSKAALYNNAAPAAAHTLRIPAAGSTLVPAITYDGSLSTMYLVEEGWSDATTDFLRISTITGTVGAEVLNEQVDFAGLTNTQWGFQPAGGADFAPQKDTSNKIQNNDSRIQNVVYRSGSLWTAHNAFLPNGAVTRTAVQWWEIDTSPTITVLQFGRIDDSTGVMFYAFPSIAVNAAGDALIGFSSFSANQYATASYAFRAAGDAAGTTRDVLNFKDGEATYFKTFTGTRNRWGDYSNTVVDPTNDTDFWTIQEYAETPPGDGFDRWGTWWARVSPSGEAAEKKRRGQTTSE